MAWNPLLFRSDSKPPSPLSLRKYKPLLSEIPYAVFGGAAMQVFFPERQTFGIDLLIERQNQTLACAQLRSRSSAEDSFSTTHHFFRLKRPKINLSVVNSDEEWVSQAIQDAQTHTAPILNLPSLPFHWLLLSKLSVGRRQDFMDCARLISRATPAQIEQTKDMLARYLPHSLSELRTLYKIGIKEQKHAPKYFNHPNKYSAWYHLLADIKT